MKKQIVIATIKTWNIEQAKEIKKNLSAKYNITIIDKKENLTRDKLIKLNPDYIFFTHWSWIIPANIYEEFTCIVFHSTDLPFGRGGSPLQNLIVNKVYQTKISAIKVQKGLDTGPIYVQIPISIKKGSAKEIFIKISKIIFNKMIPLILEKNMIPRPQKGIITEFKRRTPEMSNLLLAKIETIDDLYDFIRMLDGEGYPTAFIKLSKKITIKLAHAKKISSGLKGQFEVIYEK